MIKRVADIGFENTHEYRVARVIDSLQNSGKVIDHLNYE